MDVASCRTVVVADDDPDYRYLVRFLLGSMADSVTVVGEAGNGEEALALVLRRHPDIVVADLLMPHLNGIELTRRIKQERPETKVILMTSYSEDVYRRLALVGGADGFICKRELTTALPPGIRDALALAH